MKKNITSAEFDKIFSDCKMTIRSDGITVSIRRKPKFRFMGKYLMGSFFQMGDWSKWLHLTQIMIVEDLLKAYKINDKITYSATDKGLGFLDEISA